MLLTKLTAKDFFDLMFLVLRKARMMDPIGKIFIRDGELYIKCLCFLIIFPMLGNRGLKSRTSEKICLESLGRG